MTDSLSVLADRANLVYINRPEFVRSYVESEQPPVLAFDFTSADAAQRFMLDIEVQGTQMRMDIPSDRPETVLQYR